MSIDAPVILLGRGGSGTRMMSDLARSLGVFLGNRVNETGDSLEWIDVLYALALDHLAVEETAACDGPWRKRLRRVAADVLRASGRGTTEPWGWKLPETMLVLDPVLEAFPGARIIHLVRHPIASAMRRTHMTSRTDNAIGRAVLPAAYRFCGLDPSRLGDDAIHIHNAATWAFQVGSVLEILAAREAPVLQIAYEALCHDPSAARAAVARFLGLPIPATSILPQVDPARINDGFDADARADDVWSICGSVAVALGYDRFGSYCRGTKPA